MRDLVHKTAIITGAANGFGREFALLAAQQGMQLVLADVQPLDKTADAVRALGAEVLCVTCDVRDGAQIDALAQAAMRRFGAIHLVFNNAGVGAGGLVWENTQADWEWVLGVNLWGVIHGVRAFTPLMLACAQQDPHYEGHIVNTASMAGLLTPPLMGAYNVSKHAVVALTETLHHDLMLVDAPIGVSLLCPYFVPTGISQSHRTRPTELRSGTVTTASQRVAQASLEKAVASGRVSAADVARITFDAILENRFYVYSHSQALGNVQRRMEDIVHARKPGDPYASAPQIREQLRAGLKGSST